MAHPLNELKQKHLEAKAAFKALLDTHLAASSAADRGFTDQEKADQKAAEAKVGDLAEKLAAAEKSLELEKADAGKSGRVKVEAPNFEKDPKRGFRSQREFLMQTMANSGLRDKGQVNDERLKMLAVVDKDDKAAGGEVAYMLPQAFTPKFLSAAGADEQGEYDDRYGGLTLQKTMAPGFLQLGFEGDPTAGRTQAVPMQTPSVGILARTDKDHTSSVSGGFTVTRKPETVAGNPSRMTMEEVTLKATSMFGFAYATEEIITDSPLSFVAIIDGGFRDQFAHALLAEKIRGVGGNEYLGVLTALSASTLGPTISIAKETNQAVATLVAQNAIKMRARCWGYGNAIWIANHDCYPQLVTMNIPVGVAGQLVYQQSMVEDRPDMLLGRPIFYSEYPSTVGTQGDLILGNWSQYLEGLYQPIQSAESVHVRFVNHERTYKFWLRNAAAPWWKTAMTPHKGANSLSPFVVLDAR